MGGTDNQSLFIFNYPLSYGQFHLEGYHVVLHFLSLRRVSWYLAANNWFEIPALAVSNNKVILSGTDDNTY